MKHDMETTTLVGIPGTKGFVPDDLVCQALSRHKATPCKASSSRSARFREFRVQVSELFRDCPAWGSRFRKLSGLRL